MCRSLLPRNFASLALSICALIVATPLLKAQVNYSPNQYPPGRPQPIVFQCQNALTDRVSADAGRRLSLTLDTQDFYSQSDGRQGVRGRLRYGIGGPNTWRTATYDCIVDPGSNREERARYNPRASSNNWSGGPGYPGGGAVPVTLAALVFLTIPG